MGEGFGLGDGMNDLGSTRALAESAVSDAQRRRHGRLGTGRWPSVGTMLRIIVAIFVAIVLIGWLLTALNA
jgi:hypothetical protein